jgi:hypothetical protein
MAVLLTGRSGSGCVSPLFKFIAAKRPVEFGFPEAASRQCVLPTHKRRSGFSTAVIRKPTPRSRSIRINSPYAPNAGTEE